jgi:hypothetical protein
LSAESQNADGINNFGICLERGVGIQANIDLAAEYYKRAADSGHADGANNFGFCLEHGRGVRPNIRLAAEYYKRAADHGHPEAAVNYRRCLRLLGRWTIPGRLSAVSEQKSAAQEPPPATQDRFSASLQRFAETHRSVESLDRWHFSGQLGRGELAVATLADDPKREAKGAVKTLHRESKSRYLERESEVHEKLNHPLIVGLTKCIPASALPSTQISGLSILTGGTWIAIVVAGIALAMRYLHSRRIIHGDLKPANILVDWD